MKQKQIHWKVNDIHNYKNYLKNIDKDKNKENDFFTKKDKESPSCIFPLRNIGQNFSSEENKESKMNTSETSKQKKFNSKQKLAEIQGKKNHFIFNQNYFENANFKNEIAQNTPYQKGSNPNYFFNSSSKNQNEININCISKGNIGNDLESRKKRIEFYYQEIQKELRSMEFSPVPNSVQRLVLNRMQRLQNTKKLDIYSIHEHVNEKGQAMISSTKQSTNEYNQNNNLNSEEKGKKLSREYCIRKVKIQPDSKLETPNMKNKEVITKNLIGKITKVKQNKSNNKNNSQIIPSVNQSAISTLEKNDDSEEVNPKENKNNQNVSNEGMNKMIKRIINSKRGKLETLQNNKIEDIQPTSNKFNENHINNENKENNENFLLVATFQPKEIGDQKEENLQKLSNNKLIHNKEENYVDQIRKKLQVFDFLNF